MTFGCYNNYNLLNAGMYGINSFGYTNCCASSNYFKGQMIGALLGGALTIGAGVTGVLVANHRAKSAAQTKANTDAQKAVDDALAKMPEGYRTEEKYKTPFEQMTTLSEVKAYNDKNTEVTTLRESITTYESENKAVNEKTISDYETAEGDVNRLQNEYDNLVKDSKTSENDRSQARENLNKAIEKRDALKAAYEKAKQEQAAYEKNKTDLTTKENELNKLKTDYDNKKTEIEGLRDAVTTAITKRSELKTKNDSNKEAAVFDKADGNIATRNNIFAPKTSKARTASGEYFAALTKFRTTGSDKDAQDVKKAYEAFYNAYENLKNPSSSLSEAMKLANTSKSEWVAKAGEPSLG